ncbi:MAG: heavy metal translocating P-type ATPase [Ginsengibacter sp.]
MEKAKINLDILLPEVPDERDECVIRVIESLQTKRGIDEIHVISKTDSAKAQLCFHYNPEEISISEVEKLAKGAGAGITAKYGHLLIEVEGIRQPTHARIIESDINKLKGVINTSVSGTGFIQLEYEKSQNSMSELINAISNLGLEIMNVDDFHQHAQSTEAHDHSTEKEKRAHSHDQDKHGCKCHEHTHGGIFGEKTEMIFSIICGFLLATGFSLSFVNGINVFIPIGIYLGAYFFGGFYTAKEAIEGISNGQFEIDFLMLVAAIGAAILGHWAEGALLLFLFSLGHSLEHYAMEKARKSIKALTELAPKTAFKKVNNQLKETKIEDLAVGDIIVIKPNSAIAADGIVIAGNSSVNQAPITGESIPVEKMPVEDINMNMDSAEKVDAKSRVFAGSINGGQALEIKVSKLSSDSTIARLVQLVNEAQTQKSPTQNFTDKIEKYYVPSVLILVGMLLLVFLVKDETFGQSFYRAMAVLVAASPCALAISTPSAVLSGVARAARGGVLIKGGRPLEELGSIKAIAFDKTGTLTEGKPKLTGIYPLNNISMEELLSVVVAVENLSDHPLAGAIVKGALEKLNIQVSNATNVEAITGRGVKAKYQDNTIYIGNKQLFLDNNTIISAKINTVIDEYEEAGNTTMLVGKNDQLIGILTIMDIPREDAKKTLARLKKLGISKMIMLTGDNQKVAENIAGQIGITDALGGLMPEQKVDAIEKLTSEGKVAMVGDGVNDAPAMARSSVGIAMGAAGSDVALETADIALMADKLSNLPFAIGLSKKAKNIIKQNLVISLGMVVILIPLTITGYATIGPAVIGHEGSTLVVVFNALRLLGYKKEVV